jgi:hypothetical protein
MAITVGSDNIKQFSNVAPGLSVAILEVEGPASYTTGGEPIDLSGIGFGTTLHSVSVAGMDAYADNAYVVQYINDDFSDLDGGTLAFAWQDGDAGALVDATATTALNTVKLRLVCIGY